MRLFLPHSSDILSCRSFIFQIMYKAALEKLFVEGKNTFQNKRRSPILESFSGCRVFMAYFVQ